MLSILGIGSSHPNHIITNEFLENLGIGSVGDWIVEKIGIRQRRSVLPSSYITETKNIDPRQASSVMESTPAELGARAAEQALQRAGIKAEQLGLIICNCCNPVNTSPSTSIEIAKQLGASALARDVFSACPAFALHCNYLDSIEEESLPDYVLCVSTATLTTRVNYNDRSDSAIWGDGAAAWVVSARHPGRLKIKATTFQADPLRCEAVVVDTLGHFHQDGRAVRDFSVRQTVRMIKALETEYGLDWSRDIFVGHQANGTMLEQITRNRNISDSNHWKNVTNIGNQAGAGAPAVLAEHWDELKSGSNILVAVVGAGLSWGSVLLEVA